MSSLLTESELERFHRFERLVEQHQNFKELMECFIYSLPDEYANQTIKEMIYNGVFHFTHMDNEDDLNLTLRDFLLRAVPGAHLLKELHDTFVTLENIVIDKYLDNFPNLAGTGTPLNLDDPNKGTSIN